MLAHMRIASRFASVALLTCLLAACSPDARLVPTDQPVEHDRREIQARKQQKTPAEAPRDEVTVAEFAAIKEIIPSMQWSRSVRRSLPSVTVIDPATNAPREEKEVIVFAMFSPDQGLAARKEDILQNIKSSGWQRFTALDKKEQNSSQFVFRKSEADGFRLLIIMDKGTECMDRDDGTTACTNGETEVYMTNVIRAGSPVPAAASSTSSKK